MYMLRTVLLLYVAFVQIVVNTEKKIHEIIRQKVTHHPLYKNLSIVANSSV